MNTRNGEATGALEWFEPHIHPGPLARGIHAKPQRKFVCGGGNTLNTEHSIVIDEHLTFSLSYRQKT
jgi:hypothetical protein